MKRIALALSFGLLISGVAMAAKPRETSCCTSADGAAVCCSPCGCSAGANSCSTSACR